MKTTPKYTKHQTSHAEFYKLCEWVKTADLTGVETMTAAAGVATKAVGFPVPISAIQSAMQATGAQPPTPSRKAQRDRVHVLATELANLMRELGKEPSAALQSIVNRKGE